MEFTYAKRPVDAYYQYEEYAVDEFGEGSIEPGQGISTCSPQGTGPRQGSSDILDRREDVYAKQTSAYLP